MTESPQHLKKKEWIAQILNKHPEFQNVDVEKNTGVYIQTTLGPRPYTADVYAERYDIDLMTGIVTVHKLAIEVDGKVGHHGIIAGRKDKLRDQKLKEAGITTVRIPLKWMVGRFAISENDMLAHIEWTIKKR